MLSTEMDNRATTPFSYHPTTLPEYKTDAKKMLKATLEELDETTRTLSYYAAEDYPASAEIQ